MAKRLQQIKATRLNEANFSTSNLTRRFRARVDQIRGESAKNASDLQESHSNGFSAEHLDPMASGDDFSRRIAEYLEPCDLSANEEPFRLEVREKVEQDDVTKQGPHMDKKGQEPDKDSLNNSLNDVELKLEVEQLKSS